MGTKVSILGKVFFDPYTKSLKMKDIQTVDVSKEKFIERISHELLMLQAKFWGFFASVGVFMFYIYHVYHEWIEAVIENEEEYGIGLDMSMIGELIKNKEKVNK